jgi:hypothetical protein
MLIHKETGQFDHKLIAADGMHNLIWSTLMRAMPGLLLAKHFDFNSTHTTCWNKANPSLAHIWLYS